MKLVIQIPCYNEAETLPQVLAELPNQIDGIDSIQTVVIDDGSSDGSGDIAANLGVDLVLRTAGNTGLAHTFRRGIDASLLLGADVIVNIDADNQYSGSEIPRLIHPILEQRADIVVGDRQIKDIRHFSFTKRILQQLGSLIVSRLSDTRVADATSGFRAFSRAAALKLTVLSNYSYTLETILQTSSKGLTITNVKVEARLTSRPSRLMRSIRSYLMFSAATIVRIFTMYNPLKVFLQTGLLLAAVGFCLSLRFVYFYITEGGTGHVQSLIIATILLLSGIMIALVGLLADLIQFNRRLLEDALERIKKLELR